MTIFKLLLLVLIGGFSTERMAATPGGSSRPVSYARGPGPYARRAVPYARRPVPYARRTVPYARNSRQVTYARRPVRYARPPVPYAPRSRTVSIARSNQTVEFDELLLVLQWSTSYSNTQRQPCDQFPARFTVHGLWANKNSERVDCSHLNVGTYYQQIGGDLLNNMERNWPNLRNRNHPEHFWAREYATHASAIAEFQNPTVYFQTALAIADRIGDVMSMRLISGETLQSGRTYQPGDFAVVTLASGVRLIPRLRCSYAMGRVQLQEIVFCTDIHHNLKNCTWVPECEMLGNGARSGSFILPDYLLGEMQGIWSETQS